MVELIEKIENELKKKGHVKLGVLATYLCQILGLELEKKRQEREKIKRKKKLFQVPEPTTNVNKQEEDIYTKSMFGPH